MKTKPSAKLCNSGERIVAADSSVAKKLSSLGWEFLLSGHIWKRGVGYLTRENLRKITHNEKNFQL